jgi:hypothetical protein
VFVDDASPLDMRRGGVSGPLSQFDLPNPRRADARRQTRPEAPRTRPGRAGSVAARPATTADPGPSLVAAISSAVRLAILFAFGYVMLSLWALPEVKDVVISLVRGERPDLQPLLIRIGEWLNP